MLAPPEPRPLLHRAGHPVASILDITRRGLRLASLSLVIPIWSCASTPPAGPEEPLVLRIGLALPGVDSTISVGRNVVAYVMAGSRLLVANREGRYQSDVVRRWSTSSDGRSVTFWIDPDARFPDGDRLTPAIMKASLDEQLRSARLAAWPALQNIAAVRVVPPDGITLDLREPSNVLLGDLDLAITKPAGNGRHVGVGPFFVESESQDQTVLRANAHYRGGVPRIATIQLRSYPTVRAAWAALMRGESDFLYSVPNDAREFLDRDGDVTTFSALRTNVFSLAFNVRRPALRSASVRRALNMAVDRQEIVDVALRRHGRPATGFVWPTHWALDPDAPRFHHRPAAAFRLLFPSSSEQTAAAASDIPRGERLRFSTLVPEGVSPHDRIAIVLQKQLFEVGVDMTIEPVPVATLVRRLLDGDFDTALLDLNSGTSLARLYPYWHSASTGVFDLGYDAADAALDELRTSTTDRQTRDAIRHVQQTFYQDPPAIFLCWPETTRAVSRRFVVPDPNPDLGLAASVARWYAVTPPSQGP